jgi:hypothetical protein
VASVGMEHAKEGFEHAHHAIHAAQEGGEHVHGHELVHATMHNIERHPRQMAVMIAALAACLALAEMGQKKAATEYLTRHITLSDTYAFLQAKNIRAGIMITAADTIDSTPGIDDAAHQRVAALRAEADRLLNDPKTGEGRTQLLQRAQQETELRDRAHHRSEMFEFATGAMQIAIVLASVSIVTRARYLSLAGAAIGGVASLFALAVAAGWV